MTPNIQADTQSLPVNKKHKKTKKWHQNLKEAANFSAHVNYFIILQATTLVLVYQRITSYHVKTYIFSLFVLCAYPNILSMFIISFITAVAATLFTRFPFSSFSTALTSLNREANARGVFKSTLANMLNSMALKLRMKLAEVNHYSLIYENISTFHILQIIVKM